MPGRHRLRTPTLASPHPELSSLDRVRHEHLGWLLGRADLLFAEGVTRAMHERGFAGIRLVHIALIRNVDEHGTRITDIARRAGMTKQATGQLVAEFVDLGYVRLVPDPGDGRAKVARYTAKGKRLLVAIVASIAQTEDAVSATIGGAQLDTLKATLGQLLSTP
ncbi:MAG TPA: MarR family winged helix-turn-helix transcriptional regulator [Candidatus Lustribacter sp.]